MFECGSVSTIAVSESVINKIQRVQNSIFRLALHLPKYVLACLVHEASGLPYVKERRPLLLKVVARPVHGHV